MCMNKIIAVLLTITTVIGVICVVKYKRKYAGK